MRHSTASITLMVHADGIRFYTAMHKGVSTTPIALTVGQDAGALSVWNRRHSVRGGLLTKCCTIKSAKAPYVGGCELVASGWLPEAKVTCTLSYADGTRQAYSGTADSKGHLQHVLAVMYQPPVIAKHGEPVTRAWISVVAASADGKQTKSQCLRS